MTDTNTVEELAKTQTEVRIMQLWRRTLMSIPRRYWLMLCEEFAKQNPKWKVKVNGKELPHE